jgi:hypothetical protein
MDRKIIGTGAAILVISLVAIMGFAFAQEPKTAITATGFVDANHDGICDNAQSGSCSYANQADGFVDANNDGVCDNAANCLIHTVNGGCHGSGGCARHSVGFTGGCH